MNLNEPIRNAGRPGAAAFERRKLPLMGPPKQRAPKSKSDFSSSKFSELPWGKSHESLVLNSSSNKKSTSSRSTTDMEEDKVIVALTEGRGEARCEVGIAAVNVSRPVLILCQTSDSQSYNNTLTKLNIFNPHLIIYPATFDTGKENRLIAKIRKHFSSRQLMTIPRKAFSKANGLERLYKICIQISFPLLIMIKNRYYALAAASGLLTYLQDNMFIYYASNSIKLEYQTSEGYAIIGRQILKQNLSV
uniref:DNA mismatch repair protein MutS connector domain-containing protein n=1 Tax=Dendroctonus ponderosae TaxID=77166 RepID=A0AAR5QIN8_DENPD